MSASRSAGYSPSSMGARNARLASASILRTASRSAADDGSSGRMTCRLSVTDVFASSPSSSRIAWTARPCARLRWCTAASAAAGSVRPGACTPEP
ncbi:Uncharacterised protein [Mycobacteroides abscessus]|nr:Uncharacterised protein [Mycobacteroides abscessus]